MPLRPVLRPLLALSGALDREESGKTVQERRAAAARGPFRMKFVTARGLTRVSTLDLMVPISDGEVLIRTYRPVSRAAGPLPTHLYLHGGAFWLDSVEVYDPLCRWLAGAVDCQVISVDYRLAPEHRYPTGLEDCYAVLCWVAEHAAGLAVDLERLSVGGFSAGGGLAASVALMARDRTGPAISFQALQAPVTDLTMGQPSMSEFAEGYDLTRAGLEEAYRFYLADSSQALEPYASPLLAPDLTGMPPAYIGTSEFDPLRDEGEAYGKRLIEAGVPVEIYRAPGHLHGSVYLTRLLPSAREAGRRMAAALRRANEQV